MEIERKLSAFLIVDLQKDFCDGGTLAVRDASRVLAPINAVSPLFDRVVLTQDWHPQGHVSFASSWPGRSLYESVEADGIPQILWPDHCVQGSEGAAFHGALDTDRATLILRKGDQARLDSYSCFFENDRTTPTGLDGWLRNVGASDLFIAGLTTDFCILYTVIDAIRLGYDIHVIEDAVAGVDIPTGSTARAVTEMRRKGASFIQSGDLA